MIFPFSLLCVGSLSQPVVGFVRDMSGQAMLRRGQNSTKLTDLCLWLPVCLNDTIDASSGRATLTFGRDTQRSVTFEVKQPLSKEFLQGLAVNISETARAKPLIRMSGEVEKGVALLMLSDSSPTFVSGYSGGTVPSLYWVAGQGVKTVSFRLIDTDGTSVWPGPKERAEFPVAQGRAFLPGLFKVVSDLAQPGRDVPATIKLVADGKTSRSYRIRILSRTREAFFSQHRAFLTDVRSPWTLTSLWNGKNGYIDNRLYIEAVDIWFRVHRNLTKSQALLVQGAMLADEIDSAGLSAFVEARINKSFVDKWISDSATLGALWDSPKGR